METRHKMFKNHHPVRRPSQKSRESPNTIVTTATITTNPGRNTPMALAAPAATRASDAGMGNPMASKNATTPISRYPCCLISENHSGMDSTLQPGGDPQKEKGKDLFVAQRFNWIHPRRLQRWPEP